MMDWNDPATIGDVVVLIVIWSAGSAVGTMLYKWQRNR